MKLLHSSTRLMALILVGALLAGCSEKASSPGAATPGASASPAATSPVGAPTAQPTAMLIPTSPGQAPLISMDLAASQPALSSANAILWLPGDRLVVAAQEEVALMDVPPDSAGAQAVVNIQSMLESDTPLFLSASRDGEDLAWIASDTSIQFWNPSQMTAPRTLGDSSSPVTGIALQTEGDRIATSNLQGEITQLATLSEDPPIRWQAPSWLSNLSYSPDGRRLGGADLASFSLYVFSLEGEIQQTLTWTGSASPNLYGAFISPDWSRVGWVARGEVQIMNLADGEEGALLSHEDFVSAVQWSPDSRLLATASAQSAGGESVPVVILWDPADGQVLQTFVQESAVQSLSFSPDGSKLAVMDVNGDLQVYLTQP